MRRYPANQYIGQVRCVCVRVCVCVLVWWGLCLYVCVRERDAVGLPSSALFQVLRARPRRAPVGPPAASAWTPLQQRPYRPCRPCRPALLVEGQRKLALVMPVIAGTLICGR